MADDPGPLSGSAKPRPGDGAYLTANGGSHSGSSGSHHAGTIRARGGRRPNRGRRGGGGRGGARDVEGNGQIRQKVDRNPGGAQGQSTHGPNGQDAMGGVDGHTINGTSNHNGHSRQPQRPGRPRDIISAQSPTSTATASTVSGNLDPFAPSFTPLTPIPPGSAPLSRSNSPTRHPAHSRSDGEGGSGQAHPGTRKRNTQRTGLSSRTTPSSPAIPTITSAQSAPKSSRRAAFEQQSKLTDRSDGHGQSGDPEKKSGGGTKGRKKDIGEQKDDLVSRLTRGLKSRPYLECPICFNTINPAQPIWSCIPPDQPPAPTDEDSPIVNHYSACYTPFHLTCIRDWANRSLAEERERAINAGRDGDDVSWRCPGCQKRRSERASGYKCFCGRLASPPTIGSAPHSCGDACSRKRPGCSHACPLPCHPGPCPPCQVALLVPCPSHHTSLTVKCAVASSNNAALTPVCDELCVRERDCGNPDHSCQQLCHYGPCEPCSEIEVVRCYCGEESQEVICGWKRSDEKKCARLDDIGEEELWTGRYACERVCERLYDCGIHPCEEKCHPHPVHPLPCPTSPGVITTCPCGFTPLSQLPCPPRTDCLAAIPTCPSKCPRSRPCGHPCPWTCHNGACPPCHEQVVRPCRCGESMLVVPCDELREKVERGEDVVCERVCKALRNCGRHECGRVCCPLSYKAKSKKKRPNDELDILIHGQDDLHECHLTCGKLLGCGLHTCPKKDHKGACGRCLQASYEELICHCGHTVVYPPVACGTTITCLYSCARDPPPCGHPKTPHQCHEQPNCPPCPFLTSKPCACGKEPSIKNVRCSLEKVSCGQTCGLPLDCGYHRCEKPCHRPGECGMCNQTCNKPKRTCRHPCTSPCHAPAKCPETDPCQTIITQSCSCGHVQSRTSCGAGTSNPASREMVVLKCNSECAVRQRNARLADALGIQQTKEPRMTEEWSSELKSFASANMGFVKMVEAVFGDFFEGSKQILVLPHMPPAKRTFVMSLADTYRLGRELIDAEPNRSVQIRRRVDTRIPHPLLSVASVPTQRAPALSTLGTLKKSAWGSASVSTTTTATPSTIMGTATGMRRGQVGQGQGQVGIGSGLLKSTVGNTAPNGQCPVVPAGTGTSLVNTATTVKTVSGNVSGKVGQVDEDDWDASGEEA